MKKHISPSERGRRRAKQRKKLMELPENERWTMINCPRTSPSEFEIQSYIYQCLRGMGFIVRGEVGTRCKSCRFDLVIYSGDKPWMIIETKKQRGGKHGKQIRDYNTFGVKVELIVAMSDAKKFIQKMYNHPNVCKTSEYHI